MRRQRVHGTGNNAARRTAPWVVPTLALLPLLPKPPALSGQSWFRDFEITAGLTGEAWSGDFSAISVPEFDSTESVKAGVGEWRAWGEFSLLNGPRHRLKATLDGGIRQSAAAGFRLRNYAPREQSGRLSLSYDRGLGGGVATAEATARSRRIIDHPPMPLYKFPGYDIYNVQARYAKSVRAINVDVKVVGEQADYKPPPQLDHLDFLDRNSVVVEAGGSRVFYLARDPEDYENTGDFWRFRLFGSFGYHSYPRQGGEVQRVDHALRFGATFGLQTEKLEITTTMVGTRSRSTSPRVEYNHGRVHMQATWLWDDTDVSLVGTLARKRYIEPTQDALVAGEEADNASVLYTEVTRSLGERVSGAFRIGWRKVETNFSGAFYTRFGGGFSLSVRPWG